MACQVRQAGLDRKVVLARCSEVSKAGVVSLDYLADVVVPADLEPEVYHLFTKLIIILLSLSL